MDLAPDLGGVEEAARLILLGETKEEFGGSIWQQVSGGGWQGLPPQVDLANEAKSADFFVGNIYVAASHDLSEGGLAIAAFEMAQKNNVGVDLDLSVVHEDALTALFSESASRVLISTASDHLDGVLERASELGIPAVVVGTTNDS